MFKRFNPPSCAECGVYFSPHTLTGFTDYCLEHAKSRYERAARIQVVTDWAKRNWEKLEPQALEELKKSQVDSSANLQNAMAAQQRYVSDMGQNFAGGIMGRIGL